MLRSIIRGFIYRFTFQVIMFIITLMIAELMGVSQFGDLSLMIVNAAAFMLVTGLGTDAAIVWHVSGNKMSASKTHTFALLCAAVQFLLYMAVAFVSYTYFGSTLLSQADGKTFIIYETLYITGLILIEKYTSLLYGHQLAAVANRVICFVAMFFLLFVILLYSGVVEMMPVLVFTSMMFLLGVTLVLTFYSKVKTRLVGLSGSDLVPLLAFSGIVFITNFIQFVAYRLDFWLIDHFHGNTELGVYAQANRFAQLLWIIPGIFAGLIIPAIQKQPDGLSELGFLRLTRSLNVLTIGIAIIVLMMAWMIYQFFLSTGFEKGWQPLLIMMPGYIFFALTTILAAWFSAKKKLVVNLLGSTLCFLLIAVLDMILIPVYSVKGAAMANSVAYSITTLYFINRYVKWADIKTKDIFLFRIKDISGLKKIFADGR